jgi:transcriptional regulator with XRE-family HTH domain
MGINTLNIKSVDSILKGIAKRVKARRLEKNLTQKAFAQRAGIGYDAYRTFETTGEITLRNLVLCSIILDDDEVFESLFTRKAYQSIDEVIQQNSTAKRQRASRK